MSLSNQRFFTLRYDRAISRNPEPAGAGAVLLDQYSFYTLQFDGACSGNPGPAGAGAVLLDQYGRVLYRFREGLGYTTNNVAEYRALILGLQEALQKGYMNINVQGDSQLVINQLQGSNRTNYPHLRSLRDEALELKNKFRTFDIQYISRDYNTIADADAKQAIYLQEGLVEQDCPY